jgi:hypothetical protein
MQRTVLGCNHDSTILHRAVGGLKHILRRTVNHNKKRTLIQSRNQFRLYIERQVVYSVESPCLCGHQSSHTFAIRKCSTDFDEIWFGRIK